MILHILLLLFLDTHLAQTLTRFESDDAQTQDESENRIRGWDLLDIENLEGDNFYDEITKEFSFVNDAAYFQDAERRVVANQPQRLIYDELVTVLTQYFYNTYQVMERIPCDALLRLTEKAFYDSIGSYLKTHLLPVIHHGFYAGQVGLRTVGKLQSIYEKCKFYGRLSGKSWGKPKSELTAALCNMKVRPMQIKTSRGGCDNLELYDINKQGHMEGNILVSMPELAPEDDMGLLTNIRLPFKNKKEYCLRSNTSAFVMVKFLETVTQCYASKSICQDAFNEKLKSWLSENVLSHLTDSQFYPGLGGILGVYETIKKPDNVLEIEDDYDGYAKANLKRNDALNPLTAENEDDTVSYDDVHETDISFRQDCNKKPAFSTFIDQCKESKHTFMGICTAIGLIIFLLICYCYCCRSRKLQRFAKNRIDSEECKSCFKRLLWWQKERNEDEEIFIKSDGKSVLSSKSKKAVKRPSTSSSSLGFKPEFKLIPFSKRRHNKNCGHDLSSSSGKTDDTDNFQKYVSKTHTVNEKSSKSKEKPSTSKKHKKGQKSQQSSNSSRENSPRKQTKSSSWSTFFSS